EARSAVPRGGLSPESPAEIHGLVRSVAAAQSTQCGPRHAASGGRAAELCRPVVVPAGGGTALRLAESSAESVEEGAARHAIARRGRGAQAPGHLPGQRTPHSVQPAGNFPALSGT